jgi:glycosyltransferase involved in cell wall biosynthesis
MNDSRGRPERQEGPERRERRERRIGISLGNIGALHDGLGEFALQIGQRIAAVAPQWREQHGIHIDFHLRAKLDGLFGREVGYLHVNRWQRLRHVRPQPYALWHSLHQLNKNLPPNMQPGTRARVVTVHDLNYLSGPTGLSGLARWRQHRRTLALMRRSDEVVAISQYTANDVRHQLGWNGPLQVIHNGARSFVGAPREPLPGWALDDPRPFLYHLSRMSPSKNPQALIALARAWPAMTFVFCGPPSDDARHLRASVKLPNLQFHLGINDAHKAWAYARCTGFLFPSLTEGFGLPPIEAMHFGKPVFLARRTCLPEIGGSAADYFDDFDPATMRSVIEDGLARHAQPGRAEAIRRHAAQFDWDRAADGYLALYRRLLGLPPG